jgi:hypothetical protein
MAVGKWFVLAIELAVVASLFTGALFSGYVSINSTGAPLLATIGPFVPVALLLGILIYVFKEGGADG